MDTQPSHIAQKAVLSKGLRFKNYEKYENKYSPL